MGTLSLATGTGISARGAAQGKFAWPIDTFQQRNGCNGVEIVGTGRETRLPL